MYYGPTLLSKAGFGDPDNINSTLIDALPLAATNALGSVVAIFIIDRLGRRYILLRTVPIMGIALLILSAGLGMHGYGNENVSNIGSYVSLLAIELYLCMFSTGIAPAPWAINSEIYPVHVRGMGLCLSTFGNWISNYVVS